MITTFGATTTTSIAAIHNTPHYNHHVYTIAFMLIITTHPLRQLTHVPTTVCTQVSVITQPT